MKDFNHKKIVSYDYSYKLVNYLAALEIENLLSLYTLKCEFVSYSCGSCNATTFLKVAQWQRCHFVKEVIFKQDN